MSAETQIVIERPGPPALVAEVAPIVQAARAFEVQDAETDGEAQKRAKRLRQAERLITDHFEPTRKHLDAAKKELLAFRDGLVGPIAEARAIYDRKSIDHQAEERRKAELLERQLRERARKEEEERQIQAAIEADEAGETAEADAIMAQTVEVPAVRVAPAVAEVKGVSGRTIWWAEVESLKKLIEYVAKHPEWTNLLLPNEVALNKLAVAQQRALAIPGVRSVSREVRSYR